MANFYQMTNRMATVSGPDSWLQVSSSWPVKFVQSAVWYGMAVTVSSQIKFQCARFAMRECWLNRFFEFKNPELLNPKNTYLDAIHWEL